MPAAPAALASELGWQVSRQPDLPESGSRVDVTTRPAGGESAVLVSEDVLKEVRCLLEREMRAMGERFVQVASHDFQCYMEKYSTGLIKTSSTSGASKEVPLPGVPLRRDAEARGSGAGSDPNSEGTAVNGPSGGPTTTHHHPPPSPTQQLAPKSPVAPAKEPRQLGRHIPAFGVRVGMSREVSSGGTSSKGAPGKYAVEATSEPVESLALPGALDDFVDDVQMKRSSFSRETSRADTDENYEDRHVEIPPKNRVGPVASRNGVRLRTTRKSSAGMHLEADIMDEPFPVWSLIRRRFVDGNKDITLATICKLAAAMAAESDWFDYTLGAVLIANAIVIGLQVDYRCVNGATAKMPEVFLVIDWIFCVVFILELLCRYVAQPGRKFFSSADWKWNAFDTLVVVFQAVEQCMRQAAAGSDVADFLQDLLIVRMLKLGKLVRLVRLIRLIPELKSMVYLIMASLGCFFWTIVMMVLIMYLFAIYFTEMALEMTSSLDASVVQELQQKWGSIGSSILSLYQAISGGDDWRNFVDVLQGHPSWGMNTIIFCMYIAFATLVMLNLVTGVFVDGAQRIIREEQDNQILKIASRVFKTSDVDRNDEITVTEFQAMLGTPVLKEYCEVVGISEHQAAELFYALDKDESNALSVAEFVEGCLRLRSPARAIDVAQTQVQMQFAHKQITDDLGRLLDMVGAVCTELKHDPSKHGARPLMDRGAVDEA